MVRIRSPKSGEEESMIGKAAPTQRKMVKGVDYGI
jgi:hypothetical protein